MVLAFSPLVSITVTLLFDKFSGDDCDSSDLYRIESGRSFGARPDKTGASPDSFYGL